jgi:hypothetical protein
LTGAEYILTAIVLVVVGVPLGMAIGLLRKQDKERMK